MDTTFRIDVHHYIHHDEPSQPDPRVDEMLQILRRLDQQEQSIMTDLISLSAAVAQSRTVQDSAISLINQIADALADAKTDPAAIQALADQLNAQAASLAAAVTENTPAAEEQPPVDETPVDEPPVDEPPVEPTPEV